jgi:hypothetical protein
MRSTALGVSCAKRPRAGEERGRSPAAERGGPLAYRGRMADRPSGRKETEDQRLDRNLGELLQELRVALPGVQVLFAFLLAVPFQRNFTEISPFEEKVYFATLLCTAISAALLIAPTAYHRMTFRFQQKRWLVFVANRMVIAGLGFLALAMTGAILLITDVLFGTAATIVFTSAALAMFVVLWWLLPLRRRLSLLRDRVPRSTVPPDSA